MILRALFLALLMAVGISGAAVAAPFKVSFEITGFAPSNGNAAPTDPVVGSFVYEATSISSAIDSITSVSLTLAGHSYSLPEVAVMPPLAIPAGTLVEFGGSLSSPSVISNLTDDFWIRWNADSLTPFDFTYSAAGLSGIWSTDIGSANKFFTHFSVSAVPEPASVFLVSIGLLGFLPFRRHLRG